jgi:hypothetical protein
MKTSENKANDKAENIMNKNKYKPAVMKKPSHVPNKSEVQKISNTVMDIDIQELDGEESMPKKVPKPMSQYGRNVNRPNNKGGLRKLNSGENNAPPLLPLNEIDGDFAPRNKKIEYKAPVKPTVSKKEEPKPQIETKAKNELSTMNMIKNIKKQREQKINKSQDMSNKFVDQTYNISMNSRATDDQTKHTVQSDSYNYDNNDGFEEEKR